MNILEAGPYRVLMVRADGSRSADLDNVSLACAEAHAAYLRSNLPGNPGVVAIEVEDPRSQQLVEAVEAASLGFVVEGVDAEDGSRTELHATDNSGEALRWFRGYYAKENAGGWDLIEVYDVRDIENPERLAYWERDEA
jgi:hypothetical protein